MNASIKRIIGILIALVLVAIIVFAFSGIIGTDPHIRADREFLAGVNCEFSYDYLCAQAQFEKAISIYPNDSRYYTHLARVQRMQGKFGDAISNYQKAKQVDPSDESVLPGLSRAINEQATQTAMPLSSSPLQEPALRNPVLPESVYPIFDEDFGIIKSVLTVSGSTEDHIQYEIVDTEAYSGRYSLLISWTKFPQHWASVILAFDNHPDPERAAIGQLRSIDLSPASDYAIQFFAKRGEASVLTEQNPAGITLLNKSITLKFQDQNILFKESIGNQAVYLYDYNRDDATPSPYQDIPDGRLKLPDGEWQQFCLPLASFVSDFWIAEDVYKEFPAEDKVFNWSNVKQINIDADFFSSEGAVYIDAMRIIRVSDCTPYP
jgi:tetratricopeptide (TPR) repeat protein